MIFKKRKANLHLLRNWYKSIFSDNLHIQKCIVFKCTILKRKVSEIKIKSILILFISHNKNNITLDFLLFNLHLLFCNANHGIFFKLQIKGQNYYTYILLLSEIYAI